MRIASIIAFALIGLVQVAPGFGHQRQIPLEQFGPFLPGTAACLRKLGRATRTCFEAVARIHERCDEQVASVGTCDGQEVEALVAEEVAEIRSTILQSCQPGQLTELAYPGGVLDAQADLSNACRDQAAAVAAMLGPDGEHAPCVTATTRYARKMLRLILRLKTRTMERMAKRIMTGDEKDEAMFSVVDRLDRRRSGWAAGLRRQCGDFERTYGRTAEAFVDGLRGHADCVLSATYGNNSLTCSLQVCGNGVREDPEECDDGNTVDTDACADDCTFN